MQSTRSLRGLNLSTNGVKSPSGIERANFEGIPVDHRTKFVIACKKQAKL
jgi:hypothetical protein